MDKAILALALRRAGFSTLEEWRKQTGLPESAAEMALTPYLVGYELYRVQAGDTLTKIAGLYGTTAAAIETANPDVQPTRLSIGRILVVPLGFSVVPEDTPMSWGLMRYVIRGLEARYPALSEQVIGTTAYGRSLYRLKVGAGPRTVYYNASHHANEWITTSTVLSCLEWLLEGASRGNSVLGIPLRALLREVTLYLVPMVNPDGVDLVVGAANEQEVAAAEAIAQAYPQIPFPDGWKANLRGVDLNLNYPAQWDQAREIKGAQGYVSPAPRDYVGPEPLSERESRSMFDTTEDLDPDLTIAWHTQGKEIYWKFLDLEPEGARELGEQMAQASGYRLEEIPYASSFAGYKDWFIQDFDRPGYTIEAGEGENPLPLPQLPEMVRDNLPIFLLGLTGAIPETGLQRAGETMPAASTSSVRRQEPPTLPEGDGMQMAWG